MYILLFLLLLIGWLLGWVAFKVASTAIHILLALAIIALIVHFVRGSRRASA
ncbi:MAG: lmo0937 family membrane protein [Terriglobales bacterium]